MNEALSGNFWIQAGNPRFLGTPDPTDETLSEAVESSFPLWTESALLVWNSIPVPLSYKYDLAAMISDLLKLVAALGGSDGRMKIYWPSNTFSCVWECWWNTHELRIASDWQAVAGGLEVLLRHCPRIELKKEQFLNEWKTVLDNVLRALRFARYSPAQIPEMRGLEYCWQSIPGVGRLYETKNRDEGRLATELEGS